MIAYCCIPYGYPVKEGYLGRLKDGTFRLFSTENEYLEYISSSEEDPK